MKRLVSIILAATIAASAAVAHAGETLPNTYVLPGTIPVRTQRIHGECGAYAMSSALAVLGVEVNAKTLYKAAADPVTATAWKYLDTAASSLTKRSVTRQKLIDNDAIKAALYAGQPVIMSLPWYYSYEVTMRFNPNDVRLGRKEVRTLKTPKDDIAYFHAVIVCGWGEAGLLIQNTSGANWGTNGRAYLPYDIVWSEAFAVYVAD